MDDFITRFFDVVDAVADKLEIHFTGSVDIHFCDDREVDGFPSYVAEDIQ